MDKTREIRKEKKEDINEVRRRIEKLPLLIIEAPK
jgi:hypothetical protein